MAFTVKALAETKAAMFLLLVLGLCAVRTMALEPTATAFLRAFCNPAQTNIAAFTNWCTPNDADICNVPWQGVECSADKSTLIGLTLDANGALEGSWPEAAAGALEPNTLERLAVRGARISGAVDANNFFVNQAGSLERVELRNSLVSLDAVQAVVDAGSALRHVDISAVNARGDVAGLGQVCVTAPYLQSLRIAYGSLVGQFVADAFIGCNAAGPLTVVDFRHNALSGEIPDSLCLLSTIEELNLSRNKFTQLPECFEDLNSQTVRSCVLAYNRLCEVPDDTTTYFPCEVDSKPRAELDECGVCNGDSSTCVDCLGQFQGPAITDACGVCEGNNGTCTDCAGVLFGTSVVDACGECRGDNSTCADCAGVPNGTGCYDACDVCNGDGTSCIDCKGILFGSNVADVCGVCNGAGTSCLDCAGVPNGTSCYDQCDVCDGDGQSCVDCAGVLNGTSEYDNCDVCGGDGTTCGIDTLADASSALWLWMYIFLAIALLLCLIGSFVCCNLCGTVGGTAAGGTGTGGATCSPARRKTRHAVL